MEQVSDLEFFTVPRYFHPKALIRFTYRFTDLFQPKTWPVINVWTLHWQMSVHMHIYTPKLP